MQSPDVSEFWNGTYTTLSIEITKEHFELMKRRIEHDQKNGEHTYQIFHGNCTKYAKTIAELAGIDLPSAIPIFELLVHSQRFKATGRRWLNSDRAPRWLKPLIKSLWTISFNVFGLVLGAGIVDREVKEDPKFMSVDPFIRNLADLADTTKVITDHPFIIGHYVQQEVEEWRQQLRASLQTQISQIQSQGENDKEQELSRLERALEDVDYQLPDKFRLVPGQPSVWDTYDDRVRIWG